MTKISIINAYGTANRGDAILLRRCIEEIKLAYPDSMLSVFLFDQADFICHDVEMFERLGGGRVNGIKSRFFQIFFVIASIFPLGFLIRFFSPFFSASQRKSLFAIESADLIVSAPGGYIQDSNLSYFLALANIGFSCYLGKPVFLANQSIGPVKSVFGRFFARKILKKCKKIIVRERFSYDFCLDLLKVNTSAVVRGGDLAFWDFNSEKNAGWENLVRLGIRENELFAGMTVLEWNFPGASNHKILRENYISFLSGVIEYIYRNYGMRTVLFNQVRDDFGIVEEIISLSNEMVVCDENFVDENVFRGMLSYSRFFVGSRFHSCIFSMMEGVPTIAISYLPKTEFIMNDLGLSEYSFDISSLDLNSVVKVIDEFYFKNDEFRDKFSSAVSDYRLNYRNLADVLRGD